MENKTCNVCGIPQYIENFAKNKGMPDGRIKQCKACVNTRRNGTRWWLRLRYGIQPEYYERLIVEQEGKCKLCLRPTKQLFIDHCHTTNRIRGLLCNTCNCGLGMFGEDETLFLRAIEYLKPPADSTHVVYVDTDRLRRRAKNGSKFRAPLTLFDHGKI